MQPNPSRRRFITTAAAVAPAFSIVAAPARAAEFQLKYAADQKVGSPLISRAVEMWHAVERESNGRLSVKTFPDNELGGDAQLLSQVRIGAIDFVTLSGSLISNVVPSAPLDVMPFAWKDNATAFAAVDGDLGAYIRREISAKGIETLPTPFAAGFRQITANKPVRGVADLDGLKIRVPVSPISVELFKALGASPTSVNSNEMYTALQTHVVDAQENSLINFDQARLYEVQKTLNFSNHAWSCWWFLVNPESWRKLGPDLQGIVTRNSRKYGVLQRRDAADLDASLKDKMVRFGMQAYTCDVAGFKSRLGAYYARWKTEFGPRAWSVLEKYAGPLG